MLPVTVLPVTVPPETERRNSRVAKRLSHAGNPATPPCPGAREPELFLRRLEGLSLAHRKRRSQSAGLGLDLGSGRGQEFVGYRPYRPGEDARALDFLALARLGKPYVRVTRPEAHTQVRILLDRSDSMAVGPPGKWQSAVELALALAHIWCHGGASVTLVHGSRGRAPREFGIAKTAQWTACKNQLFATRAEDGLGLAELLATGSQAASAVVCIGDLFDLAPPALQPLLRPACDFTVVRVLAPFERNPDREQAVTWLDPEGQQAPIVTDGRASLWRYLERLATDEERWLRWCGQHRVRFLQHQSGAPFEDVLGEWRP